jgi:hypothetical protein
MGNIDEAIMGSPGQQLRLFLQELFPPDSSDRDTFANRIDRAFYANGELSELLYSSTINYMIRRLINTAEFIKRNCNKNNQSEERFIVKLREYIKEQLKIPKGKIEQLHTLLRECLKSRNKDVTSMRKRITKKDAKKRNEKCYLCGCDLDFDSKNNNEKDNNKDNDFAPEVEHIWPRTMGGLSEGENIKICCSKCNRNKQDYIDYSDFHYEEISLVSDEGDPHFSTEMKRVYELALWSKSEFKCLICQRPASYVGKLRLKRRNSDDSWHFLNIDSYCENHFLIKRKSS